MKIPFKNVTVFAGYVVNDPVLRHIAGSNDATVSLRLVSRYSYRDAAGAWQSQDEFATVVLYRKLAEDFAEAGLAKGAFIHAEGRRHTRTWTDGDGRKKTTHEVIASEWHAVHLPANAADELRGQAPKEARPVGRPKEQKKLPRAAQTAGLA